MFRAVAGCPSTMPLVTNGPFPWQCIPKWERNCITVPAIPAQMKPGACYSVAFGPRAASWWTPSHVAFAAIAGLCALIVLAAIVAVAAQNVRNARRERIPGGRP